MEQGWWTGDRGGRQTCCQLGKKRKLEISQCAGSQRRLLLLLFLLLRVWPRPGAVMQSVMPSVMPHSIHYGGKCKRHKQHRTTSACPLSVHTHIRRRVRVQVHDSATRESTGYTSRESDREREREGEWRKASGAESELRICPFCRFDLGAPLNMLNVEMWKLTYEFNASYGESTGHAPPPLQSVLCGRRGRRVCHCTSQFRRCTVKAVPDFYTGQSAV